MINSKENVYSNRDLFDINTKQSKHFIYKQTIAVIQEEHMVSIQYIFGSKISID